ncbi:hypothetical protein NM688_g617 [Phlebia brevispora]|uniref:Uncharacterized protein n=1 Tax=Phlebia brevispora TaxID=194682 RepID=A0ACC1TDI5_9APHY|nr:hypothetical protein NM688_g617 [Phlebia brevispora]
MSITHISTLSQLNGILSKSNDKISVIDFHAKWCGPCHQIAPVFEALSKQYPNVNFLKCDVDEARDVAGQYRIMAMYVAMRPTFIFLRGQNKVDQVRGANRQALENTLRNLASGSSGAFSGKGQTLGGSSSTPSVPEATSFFSNLDPQAKVLLCLFGASRRINSTLLRLHRSQDSSSTTMSKPAPPESKPPETKPFIPETVIDVPSQRLYFLSIGVLCQAIKLVDCFRYWFFDGRTTRYAIKWLLVDALYCSCLAFLRIPRLNYKPSVVILQILTLSLLNGFMFGGITINLGLGGSWGLPVLRFHNPSEITSTGTALNFGDVLNGIGLGALVGYAGGRDSHLLGQHTVRMSPISTANLNPYGQTFCIAYPGQDILIPVLLNNTNPTHLRYTLTPLGYIEDAVNNEKTKSSAVGKVERFELSGKDLKAIEHARQESLQEARNAASVKRDSEDYDEYDNDDDDAIDFSSSAFNLQKSQSMVHIRLNKAGIVRLDRVLDASNVDARLVYPAEVPVVPCPRVAFSEESALTYGTNVRCAAPGLTSGSGEDLELKINVFGVPPLSLKWHRDINGRQEPFMVEGIEGDEHIHAGDNRRFVSVGHRAPQQLTIPLTVTLDALGTHKYVLESVSDALGNFVNAGTSSTATPALLNQTVRSVSILRRPSVSFKHCGPGNPTSLLIGSEASLAVVTKQADDLDAPWDVTVDYHPPSVHDGKKGSKRPKPWSKTFTTPGQLHELAVSASAPGEYVISHVTGQYCEGDVLSPDVCKVVERPLPSAEIEWKKIHECSGDTGVSASLVLHGTPPFHVYYSMQRDNEPAVEKFKAFTTSRATQITRGWISRDLVSIRLYTPPASADFVYNLSGGRSRKKISSCSGTEVEVEVELKGTGPWNLEVQIVGPKGSEILKIPKIDSNRKTLKIPIPAIVDKEGGSFEIDLVSVEDAYGCKRSVSVPGVAVNVRRVKPTAKFYGTSSRRKVTILEGERATLPLRLTGDGPWKLKYRRTEVPHQVFATTLTSPNDELRITEKGLYEIVDVSDSQCPGSVIVDSADYLVNWIPRPSAKLSPEIQATYEPYNGSYILPPICEGLPDHVDLDLTGKPPFQIMYNVARDAEGGGSKILDQPTFSSIQPRTRFQLHTSEPARIYYEVKQIGDAAYPLAKNKNAIIPRSDRLLFEQQVLMRPTAQFHNKKRLTYCMTDALTPHDQSSTDGLIVLSGTPPFQLKLSIRNRATSETYHETFHINDFSWKLNVPDYTFKAIGPHEVIIESVQDASHCEQSVTDSSTRSLFVDVAETAAIVPFDHREHFCVGEVTQFQLEGTPPWTIGYRVNGKAYTSEARVSPFSIMQQQPGEFAVTSIAHQQKMCKAAVTDLRYTVHPLPSAQVGHGKRIIQDIHEGDQAEIVFTLIGQPPFTFTYQRTELSSKKGVQGKVMETHTVSGVTTKEYSIFSAMEGTWTVTFIQDRYCRYPPAQPDGAVDKRR